MPKLVEQSNNYNYAVETVPSMVQMPDGSFRPDGFFVNRRTDTFDVVGKVSKRYGLMQNDALLGTAEAAFAKVGLADYKRSVIVSGKGSRIYAVYDFKNHTRKLKKGDVVGLRLTAQNSFDGSLLAEWLIGLLRLICLNGMTTMEGGKAMSSKHYTSINIDAMTRALEAAIAAWEDSIVVFDRLAEVAITQAQGLNILGNLVLQGLLSARVSENIAPIWNNPTHKEDADRTLYNLYNAITQTLTHDIALTRFELAQRTNIAVLKAINRAANDDSRLQSLIRDVPVEVTIIS